MKECPICNNPVQWQDNPFRPFCSERCKLVDFSKWVSEEYRVPGKPAPNESEEDEGQRDSDSNSSDAKL